MKFLPSLLIYIIGVLLPLLSYKALAAPDAYVTNPCPSGFQFAYLHEASDWNVCIESDLYTYNNVGEQKDSIANCPLISSGDILQAWNPEAGVCFSLANSPEDEQIFTVTRDSDKNLILVDLFADKHAAGCIPGSEEAYLLSPADIYCLKDIQTEPYASIDIEGEANEYFEILSECKHDNVDNLRKTAESYQSYLEFAYYRNPNIEIYYNVYYDVDYRTSKTSDTRSIPNQGINDLANSKYGCGTPNVSRMIGITD